MSHAKHHPPKICPMCGATIIKAPSESWKAYAHKTACSMKCAALLREKKTRNKQSAIEALSNALSGWIIRHAKP